MSSGRLMQVRSAQSVEAVMGPLMELEQNLRALTFLPKWRDPSTLAKSDAKVPASRKPSPAPPGQNGTAAAAAEPKPAEAGTVAGVNDSRPASDAAPAVKEEDIASGGEPDAGMQSKEDGAPNEESPRPAEEVNEADRSDAGTGAEEGSSEEEEVEEIKQVPRGRKLPARWSTPEPPRGMMFYNIFDIIAI